MGNNPMYWGGKRIDNAIVHVWPNSPYIVKCNVNFKQGKRIICRICLKNLKAWNMYQDSRNWSFDSIKIITHKGEAE